MKSYLLLILTAVSLAFATGYVALFIQGSYTATPKEIVEINRIKVKFQKEIDPKAIINFNSIYYSREQLHLLDPLYSLPVEGTPVLPYFTSRNCFKKFKNLSNRLNFEKVWVWEEYRCGRRAYLPRSFFRKGPFMHPSGRSYTYLAFLLNKDNNRSRKWALDHLPFFHVTELKSVRRSIGELGGIFNLLSTLNHASLSALSKGQGTVLTKDFLLARIKYPSFFSILEYRFYERDELDHFLKDSVYNLHNYKQGRSCFYKDGQLCWDYNTRHIFTLANKSTIVVLLGLVVIIVIVIKLLWTRLKTQKFEDEKRRLALQVLTHEFRTPVTSLLLLSERLGKNFESMDETTQDCYLRMSSEIYRLQRLTETSRHYLRVLKDKKLIEFNKDHISSVNEFFDELFANFQETYGEEFLFELSPKDGSFCMDTYWIQICLKNLVENAFKHGQKPVTASVHYENNKLTLSVKDEGKSQIDCFDKMTDEFVKGNKSSGTGLGLNIVKKVIKEMGGKFTYSTAPTTFTIVLKKKKIKTEVKNEQIVTS